MSQLLTLTGLRLKASGKTSGPPLCLEPVQLARDTVLSGAPKGREDKRFCVYNAFTPSSHHPGHSLLLTFGLKR